MLRLNVAIPPTAGTENRSASSVGTRRIPQRAPRIDDVVTIELQAVAGATIPLVDKTYTPDGAAAALNDGLTAKSVPGGYLSHFPYLGVPHSGFSTPS